MFLQQSCKRVAAFGVFVASHFILAVSASATSAEQSLSLQQAAKQVLQQHPQLQAFDWRLKAAEGAVQSAKLPSAYELGIEAENMLGSGDMAGIDSLDLSVSLSSVFELGDKRQSRQGVASAGQALVQAQRQAASLDLLGELTQRYINVLTLQEKASLASQRISMAEQALTLVSQRVQQGATPQAEQIRAQVTLHQAQLSQGLLRAELDSSKAELASLWGADTADFSKVSGDLFALAESPTFESLYRQVVTTPAVAVFAAQQRLREAEFTLLQSQSQPDLRWQLGLVRAQQSRDVGINAAVSVPLFSQQRNQGALATASAVAQAEQVENTLSLRRLRNRLYQAWQSHRYSAMAVKDMQRAILPALQQALEQTEQGYRRGRYGYSEWISARQALQDAQLDLINLAGAALSNQALIEQLSGVAFRAEAFSAGAAGNDQTPKSGLSK